MVCVASMKVPSVQTTLTVTVSPDLKPLGRVVLNATVWVTCSVSDEEFVNA